MRLLILNGALALLFLGAPRGVREAGQFFERTRLGRPPNERLLIVTLRVVLVVFALAITVAALLGEPQQ